MCKKNIFFYLFKKIEIIYTYKRNTNRIPKKALQYKSKGRRNRGLLGKRWRDQIHLEDQGTGNTPNPS
jgi:hypothetical protein